MHPPQPMQSKDHSSSIRSVISQRFRERLSELGEGDEDEAAGEEQGEGEGKSGTVAATDAETEEEKKAREGRMKARRQLRETLSHWLLTTIGAADLAILPALMMPLLPAIFEGLRDPDKVI